MMFRSRSEWFLLWLLTAVTILAGAESAFFFLGGNPEACVLAAGFSALGLAGGAVVLLPRRG